MKFLDALQGINAGRPPLWLMRQAGRYLPEYQALRAKHSLYEMFFTPEIAAEVTLQPIRRFGFDAAVLFSDIAAIAPAMGFDLSFDEGPRTHPKATPGNFRTLEPRPELLDPVAAAAQLVKQRTNVPLIGFCGGPFTIATYFAEDASQWMQSDPASFGDFLDRISDVCIASLKAQSADAVQIFDSWANRLDNDQFEKWSLPFLHKIAVSCEVPVILFMRGSGKRAERLASIGACISVDETSSLKEIRSKVSAPLQGNLDPDLLFAPVEEVRKGARALLDAMRGDPAFIANLGHGVKPGTPLEAVAALVEEVHRY